MSTVESKQKTVGLPWLLGLGVLAIFGFVAWTVQLTQGFDVIGVDQVVVWGVYIAAFFFLLSTGCGLVLFAAAGDLGFLAGLKPHRWLLVTSALGMFIAGGILILMDIGRPVRVLNLLFSPQSKSPFIWDFYGLTIMIILTAVFLLANPKGKVLPWAAAITSLSIILIEGGILGVLAARPFWHGGMMPILFLLEALVAASGFLYLALRENLPWVKKTLTGFLALLGLVILIDAVAVLYSGPTAAQDGMKLLVGGNLAPYFWTQVLLGIILPMILLITVPASRWAAIIAAGLAILGVLIAKLNTLTAGQAFPLIGPAGSYQVSLVEWGGVLGMLALAILLGYLGQRIFAFKLAS